MSRFLAILERWKNGYTKILVTLLTALAQLNMVGMIKIRLIYGGTLEMNLYCVQYEMAKLKLIEDDCQ